MRRFLASSRKFIISTLFILVFICALINNIPSWVLGNVIQNYSNQRLKLYDTHGTFWNGSGLLVALDTKLQNASPLLYIDWTIKPGWSKFIDIKFSLGKKNFADVYLNKGGVNLDKLDLSLSLSQVSQLFGPLKDLGISGNIKVSADHVVIGKKMLGNFKINLDNISSGISRVNPLGSYTVNLNPATGAIEVDSTAGSTLMLSGAGSISSLSLKARIDEAKKEEMLQFITVMGIPNPDGSYQLKLF